MFTQYQFTSGSSFKSFFTPLVRYLSGLAYCEVDLILDCHIPDALGQIWLSPFYYKINRQMKGKRHKITFYKQKVNTTEVLSNFFIDILREKRSKNLHFF